MNIRRRIWLIIISLLPIYIANQWLLRPASQSVVSEHTPFIPKGNRVKGSAIPPAMIIGQPPRSNPGLGLVELPPDAIQLWELPSRIKPVAAFQGWAKAYLQLPDADKPGALAEGLRLAVQRRLAMSQIITVDPELALSSVVPETVRRQFPTAILDQLESTVDGRGDIEVSGMTPGGEPMRRPGIIRKVVIGDQRYAAYVYGRREAQPSRWDVPVHGLSLDGNIAVSELPGRVLEPIEAAEVKPAGADPVCAVSQLSTTILGTEVALKIGTSVEFFCGRLHATARLRTAADTETLLPPGFGIVPMVSVVAASGGAGVTVPTTSPDGNSSWTTGKKRIVLVRVDFNGSNYHHLEHDDCAEIVSRLDQNLNRWSYGHCRIAPLGEGSHMTPILQLPNFAYEYTEDDIDGIWSDAADWADDNGYPRSSYDFLMVLAGDASISVAGSDEDFPPRVTWGGIGQVGGGSTLIRGDGDTPAERIRRNTAIALHELGHNLGLFHASSRFTTPKFLFQIGGDDFYSYVEEYGDVLDTMGRSVEDYNVHYKNWLHWLGDARVPIAISDGRYIIHEHDLGENGGGLRGLEVPYFVGANLGDSLFVEYRLHNKFASYLSAGPTIRLGLSTGPKTYLLDGTPETANDDSIADHLGTWDSQLLPGRTLSHKHNGLVIHITTLSVDQEAGKVEVQVYRGAPSDNHAPFGSINPFSGGAVGQTVYFSADASDADGDDMSYYWEIGDSGVVFPNDRIIGYSWDTEGVKTVKCTVSDMHGGLVTLTHQISIVANKPPGLELVDTATTDEDQSIIIDYAVSDPTQDAALVGTTAVSGNLVVLPKAGLHVTQIDGGNRRMTITPAPNQHGLVPIYVTASDGFLSTTRRIDLTVRPTTPGVTLIPAGSSWRYWDTAGRLPSRWAESSFADSTWKLNSARFGYNQSLFTPASWTTLAEAPGRITTYFRRTFSTPSPLAGQLNLRLLCDDGAVVYLNGNEVWRQNMPEGPVFADTPALRSIEGADEAIFTVIPLGNTGLIAGDVNTIAVEVHDRGVFSRGANADVSFEAELALVESPLVSRIPVMVIPEDTLLGPIGFTVADSESPPGPIQVTATSSNQDLIADSGIAISLLFQNQWSFRIQPRTNATGVAQITLHVSDGSSVSLRTFSVTVTPVNDAPNIQMASALVNAKGHIPKAVRIRVQDSDNDPSTLLVSAKSGNLALVPNGNLFIRPGAAPDEWWLMIAPSANVVGDAVITIAASDGNLKTTNSLLFRVVEPVLLSDVNTVFFESGADWQYWKPNLFEGAPGLAADWADPKVRELCWPHGPSPLGYGGNGEVTDVGMFPFRITTYFRNSFKVPNPIGLSSLGLRLLRDDGAAVYLNGSLVYDNNLPRGILASDTRAVSDIAGGAELVWLETSLDTKALRPGSNIIAVEVHQSVMPSSRVPGDLGFDLELAGLSTETTSEEIMIPPGDLWSYFDTNGYPGEAWSDGSYDDSSWLKGLSPLGFGVAGQVTTLFDGGESFRHPTVFLRHIFEISDPSFYSAMNLMLQRDDGVVVYMNGIRVLNENVAATATYKDWALGDVPSSDATRWRRFLLDPKSLVRGRNLLAIELHQSSTHGTNMNFDAQISVTAASKSPPVFIRVIATGYEISWPSAFADWVLQSSPELAQSAWTPVQIPLRISDGWIYVTYPAEPTEPVHLFQLRKL